MLTSPLFVLNQTLEQLQVLSELLSDEFDARIINPSQLSADQRLCKEAVQTIKVLVPKLEAVRRTSVAGAESYPRVCCNCDD